MNDFKKRVDAFASAGLDPSAVRLMHDMLQELEDDGSLSIETAPQNVEVLAWHLEGKSWHQVELRGDMFGMRWNSQYRQHTNCYSHWQSLPTPPKETHKAKES